MTDESLGIGSEYQISDALWERIEPLLPPPKPKKKPGRPRMDDRKAMTAIFYVLRTGCQWKALPRRHFKIRTSSLPDSYLLEEIVGGVKMWLASDQSRPLSPRCERCRKPLW